MTHTERMDEARLDYLREQWRIAAPGYRAAAYRRLKAEATRQLRAHYLGLPNLQRAG